MRARRASSGEMIEMRSDVIALNKLPFFFQEPYTNQSTMSVASKLSLHRAYVIFRSLGLRHMVVVDDVNRVVGVVTRKDLMAHNIEERLQLRLRQQRQQRQQQQPRRPSVASTSGSLL